MDYYEGCYGCKCLAERITKLEKQLAAAREEISRMGASITILTSCIWSETGDFGMPDGECVPVNKGPSYEQLKMRLATVTAERDELQGKRDVEWAQFVRLSRDEQIAHLIERFALSETERDTLRSQVQQLREALGAIHAAWNQKPHHDEINGFNFWYSAHIQKIEAALDATK